MTQVAQKIDDDNKALLKKNEDLKIQYLAQEHDEDILKKEVFHKKREKVRLEMEHARLRAQVEALQAADKQDSRASEMEASQRSKKKGRGTSQARPKTTNFNKNGPYRPFTGMGTQFTGPQGMNFFRGRAVSATVAKNPKMRRYENLIAKLKRCLENEKRSLRQVKTLCAKEIDNKNQLEKILRQCVDDVKMEIGKKRSEGKVTFYQKQRKQLISSATMRQAGAFVDEDRTLSKAEKQQILENPKAES